MEAMTVAMAFNTNEISAVFCRCKGIFWFNLTPSIASWRTFVSVTRVIEVDSFEEENDKQSSLLLN